MLLLLLQIIFLLILAGNVTASRNRNLGQRLRDARTMDEKLAVLGDLRRGRVNPDGGRYNDKTVKCPQ